MVEINVQSASTQTCAALSSFQVQPEGQETANSRSSADTHQEGWAAGTGDTPVKPVKQNAMEAINAAPVSLAL
jgi:hypothetical protein